VRNISNTMRHGRAFTRLAQSDASRQSAIQTSINCVHSQKEEPDSRHIAKGAVDRILSRASASAHPTPERSGARRRASGASPRSSPRPQAYNRKVMTGVAVGLPLSSEAAGVPFGLAR